MIESGRTPVVELRGVEKHYGKPPVRACAGVDLQIRHGEFCAIVGPSGSGKSTLMNLIGTLDTPTKGQVLLEGHDAEKLSDSRLSGLRARTIGFVFQQFHLDPGVSALHNVADGLLYLGVPGRKRMAQARDALGRVGLSERGAHKPAQMSGGERQRVAIARALVARPPLLLADEPTGNLDSASSEAIMRLLSDLHGQGSTIVMITHDRELASRAERQITVRDGLVVDDSRKVSAA